jgi:hypothetical protein
VTTTDLTATDADNTNAQLVYTVTGALHGTVLRGGVAAASFTEADLVANAVSFQHDGSTTNGSFTVSLTDGTAAPQNATVAVAVDTPVNNPPVIAGDLGIAVANGGTVIVTTTDLTATDADNTNAQLVYTVNDVIHGTVLLGGAPALTFTEADIIAGGVSFQHDGSTIAGSFTVSVTDGLAAAQSATMHANGPGIAADTTTFFTSARPIDFNNDGVDDLLWRNGDGSVSAWTSSGGHVVPPNGPFGSAPVSATIEGTGDFNGDGRSDVLFRTIDNHLIDWTMNGGQIQAITDIGSTSANWQVAGTGDFNGDHTDDILFRNDSGQIVTWSMHSGQIAAIQTAGSTGSTSHIQGTGDFNGDGTTDVLFRNDAGQIVDWTMNNGHVSNITTIGSAPESARIAATGDFNGDGTTDILFRADDGHVTAWLLNAGHIASIQEVGSAGTTWHIQGTGDVNGDGTDDILWHNDGHVAVDWLMNGGHLTAIEDSGHTPAGTHMAGGQFELL